MFIILNHRFHLSLGEQEEKAQPQKITFDNRKIAINLLLTLQ